MHLCWRSVIFLPCFSRKRKGQPPFFCRDPRCSKQANSHTTHIQYVQTDPNILHHTKYPPNNHGSLRGIGSFVFGGCSHPLSTHSRTSPMGSLRNLSLSPVGRLLLGHRNLGWFKEKRKGNQCWVPLRRQTHVRVWKVQAL